MPKKPQKKSKQTKVSVKIKGTVKGVKRAITKLAIPLDAYGRDLQ